MSYCVEYGVSVHSVRPRQHAELCLRLVRAVAAPSVWYRYVNKYLIIYEL